MEEPRVIQNELSSNQFVNYNITISIKEIFVFHNIFVIIKLDNYNYMIWRHQILKILRSMELDDYVLKNSPKKLNCDGSMNAKYKL